MMIYQNELQWFAFETNESGYGPGQAAIRISEVRSVSYGELPDYAAVTVVYRDGTQVVFNSKTAVEAAKKLIKLLPQHSNSCHAYLTANQGRQTTA